MENAIIYIRKICEERGIPIRKLEVDCGFSNGYLNPKKISKLPYDRAVVVAKYLNVPLHLLLGSPDPESAPSGWIPVLGRVAAGVPIDAIEYIEDYEQISPDLAGTADYIGLRVRGDSMEPRIVDGDVVIVKLQPNCDNGDTAIVLVNGEEATIKRIKKSPEGVLLIPNNPAYEPVFYSNREIATLPVTIIGKVVECRAKF